MPVASVWQHGYRFTSTPKHRTPFLLLLCAGVKCDALL